MRDFSQILMLLTLLVAVAPGARGCNVPVFRYALEAWMPASYEMVIFYRGKMKESDVALIEALRKSAEDEKAPANITYTPVDISEKMDSRIQKLWGAQKDPLLPRAVLVYPDTGDACWAGALSADLMKQLSDSPARSEIARRIANGDSVVFVMLESGNESADVAAHSRLAKELAELQATMKLPKQDDEEDEFAARRQHLDIPLKLRFSVLRISRSDEKEKSFIDILMNTDKKLSAAQPIVFPVFGRARLLCALTGPTFTSTSLAECATFLTGACSCQVKDLNPGVDLLMNVSWDTLLEQAVETAAKNPEKKDSSRTAEMKPATPLPPVVTPPSEIVTSATPDASHDVGADGSRPNKLLWGAIAAAAVLVVLTGRRAFKA